MVLAWMMQHWQLIAGSLQEMFMRLGLGLGSNKLALPTVHGAGMALINKGYELFMAIQGRSLNPTFAQRLGETVDALAPTEATMEKLILGWSPMRPLLSRGSPCSWCNSNLCSLAPSPLSPSRLPPGGARPGSPKKPLAR